ncbi:MAG: PorP/SprF family type IX secretion system membrane protein [Bacteroidota bacterium]|nr:PorP/SprF family type IX secretion system membrane protein [Bacteroidota bacterium]
MKKLIGVILLSLGLLNARAQLTPSNQLFLFNPVLVNPSLAGLHNGQAQLAYDTRWIGLDGAPKTAFLRYDKSFSGNTGWDIAVMSDRIGPISTMSLANCFSFFVHIRDEERLAFGIRHHITQSYLNLSVNQLIDPTDPLLAANQTGIPVNNFDASVSYYNPEKYMVGFSYINLIPQPRFRFTNTVEQPVLSLHGWYAQDIGGDMALEAFALFTSSPNTKMNINIGCMGTLQQKFGAGLNFSPANQIGIFAYVRATEKLSVFYNYNLPISDIYKVSKQSHAIGLSFRVGQETLSGTRFLLQPTNESTSNRMF